MGKYFKMLFTTMILALGTVEFAVAQSTQDPVPPSANVATMAAVEDCAKQYDLPMPGPGHARPTIEQRATMKKCLSIKNITMPEEPGGQSDPGG